MLLISLAISITVLFVVLIITFDPEKTFEALSQSNLWLILLALVMHIFSLLFWALRIKLMCKSLGYKVGLGHSFNLVLSNNFVAAVTPSQIGGEPVRIYEIHKAGVPTGDATAVVIMERVFDGIILIAATAVSIILIGLVFTYVDLPEGWIITAYIAAAVFAALLVLFFVISKNRNLALAITRKVYGLFIRKKSPEVKAEKIAVLNVHIDKFYETLNHFTGKSKSGMAYGIIFSALYWINEFIIPFVIFVGLGVEPTIENFVLSFIFQIMICVIMMIPLTPGGAGIAEVSWAGFYALILPASLIGIFVLISRLIFYYFNLGVGFVASILIVRREAKSKEK
ncbi:MAG: flippase-like domain-containing protein [Methanocorpusculum sp.]|nr:flippase-like domain-containing protein [Methanocorpusculum sp.]